MSNYNMLGINIKRSIFNFSQKFTRDYNKPLQKFISAIIYGLISSKSSFLTEIVRKLNEKISLNKTVDRLSRNLMNFDEGETLQNNYFDVVKSNFDESTILIINDGDISKSCSSKLEGICRVENGSTGNVSDGYRYAGVTNLTATHKQPISVYGKVYSNLEKGYKSNNV